MGQVVALGEVRIDLAARTVQGAGPERTLTEREAALVEFLAGSRGTTVSRERLLTEVWGYSPNAVTRAVDNTVSRLRRKVESDPARPKWIVSTRGGGYRLEADPTEAPRELPVEGDPFFGRRVEIAAIERALAAGSPLVTAVGPGGVGKTRLAIRIARNQRETWPGGVWFCDLSDTSDARGIVAAVAHVVGIPLGADPAGQLARALAGLGSALIVLDNFEQVVAFAEETVGRWVADAPDARFLATSRERLGVDGEVAIEVPPLDPDNGRALFFARAAAAATLPVTADDATVDALVHLLDGLPLAIEIAASRVDLLPPAALLERVSARFSLRGASGRPDRQETMRATLDWSWDLLSDVERNVLAELAAFEGGFDGASAAGVIGGPWVIEVVEQLVRKSLVRRASADRYDVLVTVRDYARGHLTWAAEVEKRHGDWFSRRWDGPSIERLRNTWTVKSFRALAADLDNLVIACRRAVARRDVVVAANTARAAFHVIDWAGPFGLAGELVDAALAIPNLDLASNAELHFLAGMVKKSEGRSAQAYEHYELALERARGLGLRHLEARVICDRGLLRVHTGQILFGVADLERGIGLYNELGDVRGEGVAVGNVGFGYLTAGRYEEARVHLERALAMHRESGNARSEGVVSLNLGTVHRMQGRVEEAEMLYRAALEVAEEVFNRRSIGLAYANLGGLAGETGRESEAITWYERAIAAQRAIGDRRHEGVSRTNLGMALDRCGRGAEALEELSRALAIHRDVGNERVGAITRAARGDQLRRRGDREGAAADLDEAEAVLRKAGDVSELVRVACYRAWLDWDRGDRGAWAAAIANAEALAADLGVASDSPMARAIAEARALAEG